MKRIWWIASYPKSGNTWFRAFFTALTGKDIEGSLLDNLEGGPIGSSREILDSEIGIDSCELTPTEIQHLRPDVFHSYARKSKSDLYLKIHDAAIEPESSFELIPTDATRGAIYLIRNPLDVAVSWAHHVGTTLEKSVSHLAKKDFSLGNTPRQNQVRQILGTWSYHAHSWIDQNRFPCLVLRYEDLLESPFEFFETAARFLQRTESGARIRQAVEASNFQRLQELESRSGFIEKPTKAKSFFRKGKAGSWREELAPELAQNIIDAHREMMLRFGYLNSKGEPTF